jgi:hypothetical protein
LNNKTNRKKPIPLTFYVTEEDSTLIHHKAREAGMSLTKYLTACAVGKEIVQLGNLNEFTRKLKAQGTNLNQLATLANMGRVTSVNLGEVRDLYRSIQQTLKEILERMV